MSIADKISALQTDSSAIASAIAAKGVTVPSGSGYDDYATLIANIQTGGGGANLTSLSVTPSTSSQQITPTSPVDGYDEVNVSAVTASIDANITAGNIKDGVTILGVLGTLSSGISLTGYTKGDIYTYQPTSTINKPTIVIPDVLGVSPRLIIGVLSGNISGRTQCIGPFFVNLNTVTGQTSGYAAAYTMLNNGAISTTASTLSVTVNADNTVSLAFSYGYVTSHYGFNIIVLA